MSKAQTVHFSIEGKYLSDLAKTWMIEGSWQKAYRVLTEGNPQQSRLAIEILKGNVSLDGWDEKIHAIEDIDEDYKKTIEEMYEGYIKKGEWWYKPYGKILTLKKDSKDLNYRASLYKDNVEDIIKVINNVVYLFKKANMPPFWLESELLEKKYESFKVTKFGIPEKPYNSSNEIDFLMYLAKKNNLEVEKDVLVEEADARYDMLKKTGLKNTRKQILEQSKEKLYIGEYVIPKEPFVEWLRTYDPRLWSSTVFQKLIIDNKWKAVSSSGLKCPGDNVYHTDWVIGAGLDPSDFYESKAEKVIYDYIFSFSYTYKDNRMIIPFHGKGVIKGKIASIENAGEEDIVIVPHAGVEYFELAKRVKAVITEVGGPAAHLVINAAENNIHLCMVPNATKKLSEGDNIIIDFNLGLYRKTDEV